MGSRRQAREFALQALYQCDALNQWDQSAIELYFSAFHAGDLEVEDEEDSVRLQKVAEFSRSLLSGVVSNIEAIDNQIASASEHWSLSRMARVDRNILRLGTYELNFLSDVPVSVSINEAIEVAKRYGSDDSPMFINGVLDKIATRVKKGQALPTVVEEKKAVAG